MNAPPPGRLVVAWGIVLLVMAATGCAPKPPRGTPVEKTMMPASEAPEVPSKREWYVWHMEGLRYQALAKHSEALSCFHRALDAWPKELPEAERGMRPPAWPEQLPLPTHRAVPLDTLTKLAEVYIALREPKWAIHYLDIFEQHKEKADGLTRSLRVQAQTLLAPIERGTVRPADKLKKQPAN